ncbi:MAG TPA: adenylate/guanylate cyclase domain-containing protein, partial [Herpetosiphonaceae bacterium]|nr:adenylate/guanylate cyclase domain-containing protein [Herpetosiphonaceae bacterium]
MADLPTGTVTFLFTDIEGSTTRWEHQHEAMQMALTRHDAILRAAIEAHGGHVFKTVGDAFYAVFTSAPDALEAALAAQRAVAGETWDEVEGLRVRVALHTGTVQQRDGDYFGPPLNRVARLLSTGHGGQALLSHVTHELVRDHLPAGTALRDLGEHRLKDLIRPEHVFQLVAPDLPSDFPPLRTLENRPNNLPLQLTPFIGRERELAAVCERLLDVTTRLVTLTGPGGTGKTRLALQVAADLLDHFANGVWFVDLAPIADPSLLVSTIATALGVRETGGQSLLDSLKAYLREKQLLLVLDNFEQITAVADQVAALLAAAPALKVLVTSRVPLHVRGEHEYAVPPLPLPDRAAGTSPDRLSQYEAVRLFIDRARDVQAAFAVTNTNAPAVAEICHRLDGLPLAIELAAARVKLLSPEAILQRLDRPLKLLSGGARDLHTRQQTLRATIDWSYNLLAPKEQTLFRRLGVFTGGFDLAAVDAVCGTGDEAGDVFDTVAALVDNSVVRPVETLDGEPRFTVLETIREYALERLEAAGETGGLRRHHVEYFLLLAERGDLELRGPNELAWLNRLETEHDNLRAALQWTLDQREAELGLRLVGALTLFWRYRGHWSEGHAWLERLLAVGDAAAPAVRARALAGAGNI